MPVDKQVLLRYQVLNKCFRNRYREYTIDDLVDECNKALRRMDKPDVSKRTIQNDMQSLLRPSITFRACDVYSLTYETFIDRMEGKEKRK